jgi:enolase
MKEGPMSTIKSLACRRVLNSHVEFTNEFIVELEDGSIGIGSSSQGETISIYEDKKVSISPATIIERIKSDGHLGRPRTQEDFDFYLHQNIALFGRNNAFGLSLAFFNAQGACQSAFDLFSLPRAKLSPPCLCLNILNGGWHAYTNPVLSDFSEFMLVAKSNNIEEVICLHNEIQRVVEERLLKQPKTVVSGNVVNRFATADNRECIEFLLNVCDHLRLTDAFELMIDASAGDLWTDDGYRFAITDDSIRSSEEFSAYWQDIIKQYHLRFLEDPFREKDPTAWQQLTASQQACYVIGDNFYSSDAARLNRGIKEQFTHGVVVKPNQAGTVTAVRRTIEAAQRGGQIAITSHRSISTESTFLSMLTCLYGAKYIKIGPLVTDYSSVVRLNEIIRLTEN